MNFNCVPLHYHSRPKYRSPVHFRRLYELKVFYMTYSTHGKFSYCRRPVLGKGNDSMVHFRHKETLSFRDGHWYLALRTDVNLHWHCCLLIGIQTSWSAPRLLARRMIQQILLHTGLWFLWFHLSHRFSSFTYWQKNVLVGSALTTDVSFLQLVTLDYSPMGRHFGRKVLTIDHSFTVVNMTHRNSCPL